MRIFALMIRRKKESVRIKNLDALFLANSITFLMRVLDKVK